MTADADPDRFRRLPARIQPSSVDQPAGGRAFAPEVEETVPFTPAGNVAAYRQIAEGLADPGRSGAQRIIGRSIVAIALVTLATGLIIGAIDTVARLTAP